jgi:hypothetical protein
MFYIAGVRARKPIPADIEHRVLDRSRRRCALCTHFDNDWERKQGQLAHLDRNPSNCAEDNLAFLCLPHHDDYDTKRRQTKDLTIREVKTARDRLYAFVESGGSFKRPNAMPAYTGVLTPRTRLLFSPEGGGATPKIQIGNSGVFFVGSDNRYGALLFPALRATDFRVESVDGKMKISVQIRNREGNLIAELIRNEWKVAPPPHTWDRNYSDDALEVRDARGRIVLQVKAHADRIQIQGLWYVYTGPLNGIRQLIVREDPGNNGAELIITPPDSIETPPIAQMFEYPSELHLGQLRR